MEPTREGTEGPAALQLAKGLRLALSALILCLGRGSWAQPIQFQTNNHETAPYALARPALRTYGLEEGLPVAAIYCFALDSKGRLWTGTGDGAAYLTGKGWKAVPMPKASRSQFVRDILKRRDGSLWFGTEGGDLWRLQEGQWDYFEGARKLSSDRVNCLAETIGPDGQPKLWVGTGGGGIATFSAGHWRQVGPLDGLEATFIWRIREIQEPGGIRRLWAAAREGIWVQEGDRWRALGSKDGFFGKNVNDLLEVEEADGRRVVFATLWGQGMARWDGKSWTYFGAAQGFTSLFPTGSLGVTRSPGRHPIVWAGTYDAGLFWYADGKWHNMSQAQGFPTTGIHTLLPAPEGKPTLWIGTRGGGIAALDLGGWRTLDDRMGLPGPEVSCFTETRDPKGQPVFWIGTNQGLVRFLPGLPPERIPSACLPIDYVIALHPGRDGLWVATLKGLALLDATGWHKLGEKDGLPEGMAICLEETREVDGSSTIWVGTMHGLAVRRKGSWSLLTTKDGLPHDYILALRQVPGRDGRPVLWVSTRGGGVACLESGVWRRFGAESGLPNMSVNLHDSLSPQGRRWLWAGTLGGGLARMDLQNPSRWEVFNSSNLPGLPTNTIQRIEEDRGGRLYLSTSTGVVRLHLEWREGVPRPSKVDTFTLGDGLPSLGCTLGASFVDSLGRIWIGTAKGAVVLDPKEESPAPSPRKPVFEGALVSDSGRPVLPGQSLSFREQNLRFEFSLPSLHRKEDIRYRTQLVGFESEPRPWHPEGWREFTALPAGRYVLKLWARDFAGRETGGVEYPFRIAPAPWLHPAAFILYLFAAAGSVWAAFRARTRWILERNRVLETAVLERTRELSTALAEVKTLRGFIPVCSYCKKIRDDQGAWEQMEKYISAHSEARFSHGVCPDCQWKMVEDFNALALGWKPGEDP